jgi:PleD family two-component response regulator
MGESIVVDGTSLRVTASIGIAFSSRPEMAKALTSAADAALYAAKKAGGNTWHLLAIAKDTAVSTDEAPAPEQTLQAS